MSVIERAVDLKANRAGHRPAKASSRLRHALLALDGLAATTALLLTYAVFPGAVPGAVFGLDTLSRVVAATVCCIGLMAWQRLYQARVCSVRIAEVVRLARVAGGVAILMVLTAGMLGEDPPVAAAVAGGALTFTFLCGARGFFDAWLRAERAQGRFLRSVVVVGRGAEAGRVIDLLRHHPELGYRVCGLVGDRDTAEKQGMPWLGMPRQAMPAVLRSGAGGVVLVSGGLPSDETNDLMRDLLVHGLHIQVQAGLWQIDHSRLQAAPLAHEPFFYLESAKLSPRQLVLKRMLDLVLAGTILAVSAPVLLLCALAVKLCDRGPVLFRQTRVGRDGNTFTLLKFRTMVTDAEARLVALRDDNQRNGPLFKLDRDPRVTRVGRVLRATSLDELPQLFNVLAGSMSMVGPRPALPDEVAEFDDDLLARHRLPPGITGLWQIEARENASFYAYRHLDLFYVENWSCALDLIVLAGTAPSLITRAVRSLLGRATIAAEPASA